MCIRDRAKADVQLRFNGGIRIDEDTEDMMNALASLVKLKLYEELREKRGGVYGVRVSGFATEIPYEWYRQSIEFTCDPSNVETLIKATMDVIEKIKDEGVAQTDVVKIQEAMLKRAEEALQNNGMWASRIKESYKYKRDLKKVLYDMSFIENLSARDLQKWARKYLTEKQFSRFVLLPEGSKDLN